MCCTTVPLSSLVRGDRFRYNDKVFTVATFSKYPDKFFVVTEDWKIGEAIYRDLQMVEVLGGEAT